jgi:hypothetical protein
MNTLQNTKGYESFSKTLVKSTAQSLLSEAQEGNIDTLSTLAHLEFMSQVIELAKDELRQSAVNELDLYGPEAKTGVVKHGVTFQHREVGVRYNFENTPVWNEIKAKEDAIALERKDLEEQLKVLKSKQTILHEGTGELIEMNPPIKTSKTSVTITLSK